MKSEVEKSRSRSSRIEQETIINFNEAEPTAEVYTCNAALIRRINAMAEASDEVTCGKSDEYGSFFLLPKRWVSIRMPRRMTEEQRKAAAERLNVNLNR